MKRGKRALILAGVLAVLALCGLVVPALAAIATTAPGRVLTARAADLRRLVVDDLAGRYCPALVLTGAAQDR